MDFTQWYTVQKALTNMTLLEEHITDYLAEMKGKAPPQTLQGYQEFRDNLRGLRKELDAKYGREPQTTTPSDKGLFCQECMSKHLWLIQGLAEEGVGFFPGESLWGQIRELASHTREKIKPKEKPLECPTCGKSKSLEGHVTG